MKLRVPVIVVVLLMVLVSFSGISRNASADEALGGGRYSSESVNGTANLTLPTKPSAPASAPLATLTSPIASGIVSGQNTYVYTFDTSNEGFTKPVDYTYSDVHWDSTGRSVYILSERADPGDERLVHTTPTLDPTSDFTITARWSTTTQGNWQGAYPVFIMSSSNTKVLMANSIAFNYYSRDSYYQYAPWYFLYYYDASGAQHNLGTFVAQINTEYHFLIHYDSSTKILRMEIRSATDITLCFGQYRIGTNPNDGFTLGVVGASAAGNSNTWEPATVAWTDDIAVTYATGSYRDATEDQGDHTKKIGWLADNFNDNTNEIWTVLAGSVSFTGGQMQLGGTTAGVEAGSSWYDLTFEFTFTISNVNGFWAYFRANDGGDEYELTIWLGNPSTITLARWVGSTSTTLGSFQETVNAETAYKVKIVAAGNAFEVWWNGVLAWSGTDSMPPSPISGNIIFATGHNTALLLDDVRVWNTPTGSWTDIVRDAGTNRPLRSQIAGTVDAFNQIHLQERSSADNVAWGPWTNLKSDVKAGYDYSWPDQDQQRYYQVRAVLTSGVEGTPSLTSITTATGTPSITPTANTGFEAWYPYVGGLVNAVNGNLWYSTTDLSLRAKGFTLSVARSYNSLLGATTGPFGNGWTFNYNQKLTVNGDNSVTWADADGSQQTFHPKGTAGTYDAPRGVPDRLIKNADNTFTLWQKDGSRELFTSAGILSSIADKNGNALILTHTSGRLTSVADDSGKAIYFGYDASGRIVRAWDQAVGTNQRSPTAHLGSWKDGQNAFSSNNLYASTKTASATHTYSGYGFTGIADVGIWRVEACVEAYTAGDDDLGVRISTDGGATWSAEQAVNLPASDPNTLTCLDFTSAKATWMWSDLSDANFRVQIRYIKVGSQASYDYLDWIPVKVSTASRLVRYVYDGSGNLIQAVDPMGVRTEQYWYASSKLTEMTDHTGGGKYLKFTYDASNRATEVWLGSYNGGVQWKYRAYQVAYSTTTTRTITNARGYTTTLTLNSFGDPTQISGPSVCGLGCSSVGGCGGGTGCAGQTCICCDGKGNVTSYAWDGEMNRIRITDGRGYATTTGFDFRSNVVSRVDAGGNISASAWSELNTGSAFVPLPSYQTDFRGFVTTFTSDVKGNLVRQTNAKGDHQDYAYDASGFLNRSTDFRGYTTWYEYNANGYLTKAMNALSEASRYGYDAWGHVTTTTSPLNFVTTTEYDKDDRVTKTTDPLGNFTTNGYNARGDPVSSTDKNGYVTTYQVNVTNGKVKVQTDALGNATRSDFDLRGNVLTLTDANDHVTRFEYDAYDRLTKITTPLGYTQGFSTSYAYDAAGNRIRRSDANGISTLYTYDRLERPMRTSYPDGSRVTTAYDANGNPSSTTGLGYGETKTYDEFGHVSAVSFNYGTFQKTLVYGYDANGNRLSMQDAEGGTTSYAYDAANRAWKITDPEGRVFSYMFDKDSRITSTTYPNGVTTTNTWDAASRLRKVESKTSGGVVIESYEYTYDKAGNRLSLKLADGSVTSYEYDQLNRLAKMIEPGPYPTMYAYDAVGNLKSENSAPTYTYDEDDRLTLITWGGSIYIQYTYDNNGNRRTEYTPRRGQSTFSYDYENRLIYGYSNTYTYAPTGERVSTAYTTTTYYGLDVAASGGLSDLVAEYDSTGVRQARYTHGPGADEPVEQLRGGAYYAYQKDGLGSVSRITDASQATVNTYDYSPWGDTMASGPLANPFQYTGREADPGSQLYHYRARVYDPAARRFVQKDPAGMVEGSNLYAYGGDNPTNFVDPSGRMRYAGPTGGGSVTFSSSTGTYESAYCDSWAVRAGVCIPSSNAPDASLSTSPPVGASCDRFGKAAAIAAGIGCGILTAAVIASIVLTGGLDLLFAAYLFFAVAWCWGAVLLIWNGGC
jgi:RHS repeat-associated protein